MPKTIDKYELSNQTQLTEDQFTQCLKQAYNENRHYSRLSNNAIVVINAPSLKESIESSSADYVAEYKNNSSVDLPTHPFKLTNQAYLHMRRTGIDQSILLNGESGSGKTENFKAILHHLVQLSSQKKTKLQAQMTSLQVILEAFGHSKSNASLFGKYIELQFNERGRMIGAKLLNYLLDKSKALIHKNNNTFNVFYLLMNGASSEEKSMLQLQDQDYPSLLSLPSPSSSPASAELTALKQAMRVIGINKKYQARIWQVMASLLHLSKLEFVDSQFHEAATIKNVDLLEVCADALGVDPRALEGVLTYKTQMINKDVTTLILDARGASHQRDDMIQALYSLLFTWLIEHVNSKLCSEEVHNFIGVLDLPGPSHSSDDNSGGVGNSSGNDFYHFSVNLANERFQHFCQHAIFETDIQEYCEQGVPVFDIPYFSNQACVELLHLSKHNLVDLINNSSSGNNSSNNNNNGDDVIIDTFKKHNVSAHDSFSFKQKFFSIQHFSGQVTYSPTGFIEANQNTLNPDLVQLIKGDGEHAPASYNSFVLELFNTVNTQSHPKQPNSIMNAQQTSGPLRTPSTSRKSRLATSSSLKTTTNNTNTNTNNNNKRHLVTKLTNMTLLTQLSHALDDLFTTLDETLSWFVFCIKPSHQHALDQFDAVKVRAQVRAWGLPHIAQQNASMPFNISYTFDEFAQRYHQFETVDHQNVSAQDLCQQLVSNFGWIEKKQVFVGATKIYLDESLWQELENKLRQLEKEEQRKEKEEKRIQENLSSLTTPALIIERDHSTDTLSHQSFASNTEFLSATHYHRGLTPHHVPGSIFTDDQRSFLSDNDDDHRHQISYHGSESNFGSQMNMSNLTNEMKEMAYATNNKVIGGGDDNDNSLETNDGDGDQKTKNKGGKSESKNKNNDDDDSSENEKLSTARKNWLRFVWFMTWWVPTKCLVWCGKMKRHDIQIAWREKFTLCLCIFFTSAFVIWFLVFFGELVCPHQDVFSISELQSHKDPDNAYVAIRGEVFDLAKFAPRHWASTVIDKSVVLTYGGTDASSLFPVQVSALCEGVSGTVSPYVSLDYNSNLTDTNAQYHNFLPTSGDPRPDWYFEQMTFLRNSYKLGSMGYTPKDILNQATGATFVNGKKSSTRQWAILNNNVYDLTSYILGGRRFDLPQGMAAPPSSELNFLDNSIVSLFSQMAGQDITKSWNALPLAPEIKRRQEVCLRNLYYVGGVDQRNSVRCLFAEYLLLIVTVFLCLVIVFKFLAALQFRTRREPERQDKFVICQVPCYTEGEEELKKTIDSIAALQYDDKRKLLFIICDGMIIGGGNDRPTPRIVLDILGVNPDIDPEPLSFFSVGEGQKQHNMGKVYSGLYECQGHVVPYIVVSKVGKPSERQKPGNRGKRDSQLILMNFLNKIHFNAPMSPMELELYHQIKNVIGVNPGFYEFVLMVDADTEVMADGLNRMVSVFAHDSKIIGLCGETVLSNEKDSWVTMIQVYEYFISHYMIKAFESLFGSVTCLPGCFCMYRIRSPQKNQPLLISNQMIEDYSINKVDTLHKKNLLHLGEDRYLTTLILKHFPTYKTKFVSDAKCATNAPDQWSVLLSQRRRWINSTIHNLGELVFLPQLCGFCCFSMRFVVMLDLFSTLVQPAIVGYLVYLIYTLAKSTTSVPIMSIITIAGVYGLQAMIFLLHRKWEHIIWMIVSAFAIPVFSFMIPLYAYWHFDDFSWGNTRVVMGDKGKTLVMADEGKFNKKSIPTMTWEEHEKSMYNETTTGGAAMFDDTASIGSQVSASPSFCQRSAYSQGTFHSQQSYNRPYNAQNNSSFIMQQQPSSRGGSPAFGLPAYPVQPGYAYSSMGYTASPPPGNYRAQSPFH